MLCCVQYMGEKVLVPHLYLAAASQQDINTAGASMAAREVNIVAGSIVNKGGLIEGKQTLTALANQMRNSGGTLMGGDLTLVAKHDIINSSGLITGNTVAMAAGGNILSETATLTANSTSNVTHTMLAGTGGIVAKDSIQMQAGNDITLKGSVLASGGDTTLAAGRDVNIQSVATGYDRNFYHLSESSTTNTGAQMMVGGDMKVTAQRDISVAGSQVMSGKDTTMVAGNNLSVVSVQDTFSQTKRSSVQGGLFGGGSSSTSTINTTTAKGSNISGGGNLTLLSGAGNPTSGVGDITVVGSGLNSGKNLNLAAAGNVVVASAQDTAKSSYSKSSTGFLSSSSKKGGSASVTQRGSTLVGENVTIDAGKDITFKASNALAAQNVALGAGGNIVLDSAQNEQSSYHKSSSSQVGLMSSGSTLTFASSKQKQQGSGTSTNIGSAIVGGNDVTLQARQDITSVGSLLSAANDATLVAGRDVNLVPGHNTSYAHESSKKSSISIGTTLDSSGLSSTLGYQSTAQGSKRDADKSAGSLVQAGNNITVVAARDINQVASHMEAGQDITLTAGRDWNMVAGRDTENLSTWRKEAQVGLTIALQQNVTKAVQAMSSIPETIGSAKGGAGFTGISAASAGIEALSAVYKAALQTVSVSLDLGASQSSQKAKFGSSTAAPSTVTAGRDVDAFAGHNIFIQGGKLVAGQNVTLEARNDLIISAAQNTWAQDFSSSSSSASVGVSVGFGAAGFNVSGHVSAAAGAEQGQGSGASNTNALVVAGGTIATTSGADTTVSGANVLADRIIMDVGNNLNVASLQDTSSSTYSSWDIGASVGFDVSGLFPDTIGGVGVNGVDTSLGITAGMGSGFSDSQWVNGQTAIAGKSEVDIYVGKNTDITGAVITAENGSLTLNTDTLTHANLQDHQRSESWNANIGIDLGLSKPNIDDVTVSGDYASGNKEQVDKATVGQGTILVRSDPTTDHASLNRDTNNTQEVTQNDKIATNVYINSTIVRELIKGHDEVAEQHNFMPNWLPGALQNESTVGQDAYVTKEDLTYDLDGSGNPRKNQDASYWASTENPFLQFTYHVIPGFKSFSEIHDLQMKVLEKDHADGKLPFTILAGTIVPSFFKTFVHATGNALDVTNWKGNWDNYIKKSFEPRAQANK